MGPSGKLERFVSILSALLGAYGAAVYYDHLTDGQLSDLARWALRPVHAFVESFLDGRHAVARAEAFLREPLPRRGKPWPEVADE